MPFKIADPEIKRYAKSMRKETPRTRESTEKTGAEPKKS